MHPIVATFVLALGAWTAQFNEDAQTLELSHADANVRIVGTLAFEVEGQPWRNTQTELYEFIEAVTADEVHLSDGE